MDMNDTNYEPETGGEININFDKKTESNLMRSLLNKVVEKGLQEPQPSAAQVTMETAFNGLFAQFVTQKLGGGDVAHAKPGILSDLLNSNFGANLGQGLGNAIPAIVETLTKNIGKDKTAEIVDATMKYMNKQNNPQPLTPEEQQEEKKKDLILQLDENDPEHLKAYADNMGLSMDVASGFLKAQKLDILAQREKRQALQLSPPQSDMQKMNADMQQMQEIIKQQNEVIQKLQNKKQLIEEEQAEQEYEKSISPDARWNNETDIPRNPTLQPQSANLFNNRIVVDLDDIAKGSNIKESFFAQPETPKEIPELIEEKDEQGNSTFKMSGEEPKIEITTQAVQPITPKEETPKEEVKVETKDEPEIDEEKVKEQPINQHEVVKEELTVVSMPNIEPVKEETKTEDVKEETKEEVKTESIKEDRKKPVVRKVKK